LVKNYTVMQLATKTITPGIEHEFTKNARFQITLEQS